MNKQMKKLARKYFWQQKRKEVVEYFEDCWSGFFALSLVLGFVFQAGWLPHKETGLPACKAIAIVGICLVGLWILIGLITLIKVIAKWLRSNWKEALERARRETIKKIKLERSKR